MRTLLLNPPAPVPFVRDGYCCTPTKGYFFWHPLDLLVQSGHLATLGPVTLVDAITRGLSFDAALREVAAANPRAILTLAGHLTREGDRAFWAALRRALPGVKIIGSGDELRYETSGALAAMPELDGALLDFTSPDLAAWLAGGVPGDGLVVRQGTGLAGRERGMPPREIEAARFSYPRPRHELFTGPAYRMPSIPRVYASVLTSYGCNQSCTFCNVGRLGAKLRDPGEVLAEIEWLRGALGVSHVFFRDATLTMDKAYVLELCANLRAQAPWLTFNGWTRVDLLDEEILRALKAAGLEMLSFGLESGDAGVLRQNGKDATPDQAREALALCRALSIRTLGHFVIGLPGETSETFEATMRFAEGLPLDYAAFTVAEPRPGTALKRRATARADARWGTARHGEALRRFYLRPELWARHARRLTGLREALVLAREARDFVRVMAG